IVAIVLISCVTGAVKEVARRRSAGVEKQQTLLTELRALRDEVRLLRKQNTDLVLGLDTSMDRMEHRLQRVEERLAALPASTPENRLGIR
ncbi:MAG TPA: hypothetical protein VFU47_14145, partial [Armatimonadota bacterium]|nr:hypothetical protein [Armatimonadota bacterium]